jgi:tripartite-type tricarboxylate transporter receptor subunit TctC
MKAFSRMAATCAAAIFGAGAAAVWAQTYPTKPVRVVIPFPPGQATDVIGRIVAQKLGDNLGKSFVVDNRPGANGILGVETVAKSPADGYTLLVTASGSLVINPNLYSKLAYKPLEDLTPIALLGLIPLVVVAHPTLPVKTVPQLISLAKSRPGALSYASSGPGSAQHLAMELFKWRTGMDILHVPYKGSAPAVTDLMSGQVQLMFDTIASSLPLVRDGRVKPLGVGLKKRSAVLPNVPTLHEAGVTDFEVAGWSGFLAPAKTPRAIIQQLNGEVLKILNQPDSRERIVSLGMEPANTTPEEFAEFMKSETAKWAQAVKVSGVKPE